MYQCRAGCSYHSSQTWKHAILVIWRIESRGSDQRSFSTLFTPPVSWTDLRMSSIALVSFAWSRNWLFDPWLVSTLQPFFVASFVVLRLLHAQYMPVLKVFSFSYQLRLSVLTHCSMRADWTNTVWHQSQDWHIANSGERGSAAYYWVIYDCDCGPLWTCSPYDSYRSFFATRSELDGTGLSFQFLYVLDGVNERPVHFDNDQEVWSMSLSCHRIR